jgi:hypothetical protein
MYVEKRADIETSIITKADRRSGYIRILFPVFSAAVAILLSYWNTTASMALFTVAIVFNLLPMSSNMVHKWLDLLFSDDNDLVEGNYNSPMADLAKNEEFICVPKSAVFDHHRFKEADTEARALLANKNGRVMGANASLAKGASKNAAKGMAKNNTSKIKAESKLDKVLEKEINEEIKDGSVKELIVKKEL